MVTDQGRDTWYDLPERASPEEVARLSGRVSSIPLVRGLLDGFPSPVVLVDEHRQIVACNQAAVETFGATRVDQVLGRRPGEALDCIHATDMLAGCGTAQFCAECGAAQALRTARETREPVSRECRITAHGAHGDVAYDFRVHAAPLTVAGEPLTMFAIQDIADEKRRQALERIFFHDVLNTANAIQGITSLMAGADDAAEKAELTAMLRMSSTQLVQEISTQRDLLNAERGDLEVGLRAVPAGALMESVHALYAASPACHGKTLTVVPAPRTIVAKTDPVQAARSLGNLVKNALEAARAGETVTLSAQAEGGVVRFHVHNPGVMPEAVQLQVFHRSFSTKAGPGRGTGTYSVKLLVERYLDGHVSFVSNTDAGTTFTIDLPAAGQEQAGSRSRE